MTLSVEEKLKLLAETIDAEGSKVKQNTILSDLDEWDSMGIISVIVMLDKKFNKVKNEMIEELLRWDISTHDPLPIPRQRYRFRRNEHNYLFH